MILFVLSFSLPNSHIVQVVTQPLRHDNVPVDHVEDEEERGKQDLGRRLQHGRHPLLVRPGQVENERELGQLQEDEENAREHPDVEVRDVADPGHGLSLGGKHGGQREEDGHGHGQALCNGLGGHKQGQPGDRQVDCGRNVRLKIIENIEFLIITSFHFIRMSS